MFNESLVTVWSAPNYCYRCGNTAAILALNDTLNRTYIIFKEASQVSHIPNNVHSLLIFNRKTEEFHLKNLFQIISYDH